MDPLDTCPIPGRRDTSKAARRRIRLAIIAEKWADGEDPLHIMHTWGTTYDGMRSMIRANPDIKLPDDMAKRLHKICREAYPKNQPNRHRSGWDQYEKNYYTYEILFLNSFNVPAIDMLKRLDVSWTMWKQIITENNLTRLQNETYNACRWHYLKQQHPDWTDQQITQARHTSESSFNDFMQDDSNSELPEHLQNVMCGKTLHHTDGTITWCTRKPGHDGNCRTGLQPTTQPIGHHGNQN